MIHNWHGPEAETRRAQFIDRETGLMIFNVFWCDTVTGAIRRYLRDENGELKVANGRLEAVEEVRNFAIVWEG
jgi:hypothetical protein